MSHFNISLFKSILRLIGCIASTILAITNPPVALITFAASFTIAEVLGILEEVFDKRKE